MMLRYLLFSFFVVLAIVAAAGEDSTFRNTAQSVKGGLPPGYVPPLIGNGNLNLLVDAQGGQSQRAFPGGITPAIWWAGRRYGPPNDHLIPFGHFEQQLTFDGQPLKPPTPWTQTLDTRQALVTSENTFGGAVTVQSEVFIPLSRDVVVVRKRIIPDDRQAHTARVSFRYRFAPPRRATVTRALNAAASEAEIRYTVDGLRMFDGMISLQADAPARGQLDKDWVSLSADLALTGGKPAEVTFFLSFTDSMDDGGTLARAAALKQRVRSAGFAGLRDEHRQAWAAYWNASSITLPDARLERVYHTALYHLRCNATKWSFPVAILDTHWSARFFGWDEAFMFLGLASSNHLDISRREPDFRFSCLPKAMARCSHYSSKSFDGYGISYGARYPWETLEDGSEASPPGFWHDHVFHMSHIALCAWVQFRYTGDRAYLKQVGYPIIRECAAFFQEQMVYELPDGTSIIGKCTDLERIGPAKLNPFMTSCGAIHTLEAAARAAAELGVDAEAAVRWRQTAGKLRASLPNDGEKYIPCQGSREKSIATVGGLFPYPVLEPQNKLQQAATYDFLANIGRVGNMYPVGKSVSPWYASWMASALAVLGDREKTVNVLAQALEGAGCFGELFEIKEPKVAMHPWFATAAGNFVFALNQVLLRCQDERILIAPAAPESWRSFAFTLPCYGNLLCEAEVRGGRLARLVLKPGDPAAEFTRTLILPARLAEGLAFNKKVVRAQSVQGGSCRLELRFRGTADLMAPAL